jgi:hypothetical protein
MTRHDPRILPALAERRMVLATDLDGTFLGGAETDRQELYAWIEENRASVGLIFVTGRDPGFIESLCTDGAVPRPDYVIGDVGTTIARMGPAGVEPLAALEAEIAALWNGLGPAVRSRARRCAGPAPAAHRVPLSRQL